MQVVLAFTHHLNSCLSSKAHSTLCTCKIAVPVSNQYALLHGDICILDAMKSTANGMLRSNNFCGSCTNTHEQVTISKMCVPIFTFGNTASLASCTGCHAYQAHLDPCLADLGPLFQTCSASAWPADSQGQFAEPSCWTARPPSNNLLPTQDCICCHFT